MVLGSSAVAVTSPSDFAPASSKEFLDIQATIECGFTLKSVRDMTRTYSIFKCCPSFCTLYLWPLESIIFNSLISVTYINISFNEEHSCHRFKYNFVKNSRSNTDSVSKLFYDLVALLPFQWRYRRILLVILFIVKLYGRECSNKAVTHFTFPKALAKWPKCTHVLTFDVNFSISCFPMRLLNVFEFLVFL